MEERKSSSKEEKQKVIERVEEIYYSYSYASPFTLLNYIKNTAPWHYKIKKTGWELTKKGLILQSGGGDCDVFSFMLASKLKDEGYKTFISYASTHHSETGIYIKTKDKGIIMLLSPSNYYGKIIIESPLLKNLNEFKIQYPMIYLSFFFRDITTLTAYISITKNLSEKAALELVKKKIKEELKKLKETREGTLLAISLTSTIKLYEQLKVTNLKFFKTSKEYLKQLYRKGYLSPKDVFYFKKIKYPPTLTYEKLSEEEKNFFRLMNRILFNNAYSIFYNHLEEENKEPFFTLSLNFSSLKEDLKRYEKILNKPIPKKIRELYERFGVLPKQKDLTYEEFAIYITAFRYGLDRFTNPKDLLQTLSYAQGFALTTLELYKKGGFNLLTNSKKLYMEYIALVKK